MNEGITPEEEKEFREWREKEGWEPSMGIYIIQITRGECFAATREDLIYEFKNRIRRSK